MVWISMGIEHTFIVVAVARISLPECEQFHSSGVATPAEFGCRDDLATPRLG